MPEEFHYFKTITVIRKLQVDTHLFYGHESDLRQDAVVSAFVRHTWPQTELRRLHLSYLRRILEKQQLVPTRCLGCLTKALVRRLQEVPVINLLAPEFGI
jgi:hypothetical protein